MVAGAALKSDAGHWLGGERVACGSEEGTPQAKRGSHGDGTA